MVALLLTLAAFGLLGGALGGAVAGFKSDEPLHIGTAFLVYLGILAVVGTTWSQSMEALPLTLVYGAAMGALPFGAAFLLVRTLVCSFRSRRSRPSTKQ
jgi:uncharacterized membrane protein YfcA